MKSDLPQRSQSTQSDYSDVALRYLTDREHVRLRPAMYLGATGNAGLYQMVLELVEDSLEQASCGHVTTINVTINHDGSASVENNGPGIPVVRHTQRSVEESRDITVLEAVMTKLGYGNPREGHSEKEWRYTYR